MDDLSRFVPAWNDIDDGLAEGPAGARRPCTTAEAMLTALEGASDNVILVDRHWRIAFVNRRARHIFADFDGGSVGSSFWDFWPRKGSAPSRQMLVRAFEQQSPRAFEDFIPELDTWFEIQADPWEGGLALHLRDVTERRCAADELAGHEARYRMIVENAAVGIVAFDDRGFIDTFNRAAAALFGCGSHEAIGRHIASLVPELGEAVCDDVMVAGPRRVEGRRGDGTAVTIELSLTSALRDHRPFYTAVLRPSDKPPGPPSCERQLRQISGRELLGSLVGGISHDFNNLLLVVTSMAELASDETPPDSPAREHLETMQQALDRAEGLVRQVLALCRGEAPRRERLRLADAVGKALDLLRAAVPKTIAIHRGFTADSSQIVADPIQLCQVVLNLGLNAAAAIGPRHGTIAVDLAAVPGPADLAGGPCARLTVRDDGTGMPADVLARAFEPFFTTKAEGEGTGLGLSVVQGFVAAHLGAVAAESEPGVGTIIDIYLPLAPTDCTA